MSNYQEFSETLQSFKSEVRDLELASKAYQKLSELVERYDKAVQTLENASGKVNESLRQLLQESEVMKETAIEMNPITPKFREEVI